MCRISFRSITLSSRYCKKKNDFWHFRADHYLKNSTSSTAHPDENCLAENSLSEISFQMRYRHQRSGISCFYVVWRIGKLTITNNRMLQALVTRGNSVQPFKLPIGRKVSDYIMKWVSLKSRRCRKYEIFTFLNLPTTNNVTLTVGE